MDSYNVYNDIAQRTDGDIYIGVVGPVRTGKSTFIKRFMDLLVIPNIDNEFKRERAMDELPQSADGKTIMTTEPKFIPNEAVEIKLGGKASFNVRMIDCVGYIVDSALGHTENGEPRMVSTPWFENDIPFNEAAEIGTRKVIREHSTIGLVVTTDGSICGIPREEYVDAERRVIEELKAINKPFIILLNSTNPQAAPAQNLKAQLEEKYGVIVHALDCAQLSGGDINDIMENMLFEFPVVEMGINLPKWIDALDSEHYIKSSIFGSVRECVGGISKIKEIEKLSNALGRNEYITDARVNSIELGTGNALLGISVPENLFYKVLGETSGFEIDGEDKLITLMQELSRVKRDYDKIECALDQARQTGYGIVSPSIEELTLEEPQIVKQGGRFGVRLRASAPSIHIESSKRKYASGERRTECLTASLCSDIFY